MKSCVSTRRAGLDALSKIPPRDRESGMVSAVIETVGGSPHKFRLDERSGTLALHKVLPAGFAFPFDFGFVPSTLGQDGDPLDIMVLLDAPTFPGCVISCRLVGVLKAKQRTRGRVERNDRLLAVVPACPRWGAIQRLSQLKEPLLSQLEQFFVAYNGLLGKRVEPAGRGGPAEASRLVREGARLCERGG